MDRMVIKTANFLNISFSNDNEISQMTLPSAMDSMIAASIASSLL